MFVKPDMVAYGRIRTNDFLKSWHRQLKRIVSAPTQTFKIVRELRAEQGSVEQELRALRLRASRPGLLQDQP